MNYAAIASWALKILALVPVVANGIHATHTDATLAQKTAAASDAFQTVAIAAKVLVPDQHAQLASDLVDVASKALEETVAALHAAKAVPAA